MILEASLDIRLLQDEDRGVIHPQICSDRRMDISRIFVGKTALEVQELLPRLYSICGMAHRHASALACGLYQSNPWQQRRDEILTLAEIAREHCLHIFAHWQVEAKHETIGSVQRAFLALKQELDTPLESNDDVPTGADRFSWILREVIEQHILGCPIDQFLGLRGADEIADWCNQAKSPLGPTLMDLKNWSGSGSITPRFLPRLDGLALKDVLLSAGGEAFAAMPTWMDGCRETGPVARQTQHPLVKSVGTCGQIDLFARGLSRLVDLATVPQRLDDMLRGQKSDQLQEHSVDGIGQIETARGLLVHAAQLDGDRIERYRILAPTEWNFHPQGAAAQCLKTLKPGPDLERRAEAIVRLLDPCVAFSVSLGAISLGVDGEQMEETIHA